MESQISIPSGLLPPQSAIWNLLYNEDSAKLISDLNQKFKHPKIRDITQYPLNQPITHSNTPKALWFNLEMLKISNGKISLLSPEQLIQYWGNTIPEFNSTYADTNSIAIYPKAGPNEELRGLALKLIEKTSTKVPLIISNLGVAPSDNDYGFIFTINEFTTFQEALYLEKDQKVSLNKKGKLEASKEGVPVWTPSSQSGLCGLYRIRNDSLGARLDDLLSASGGGRVQLISSP